MIRNMESASHAVYVSKSWIATAIVKLRQCGDCPHECGHARSAIEVADDMAWLLHGRCGDLPGEPADDDWLA